MKQIAVAAATILLYAKSAWAQNPTAIHAGTASAGDREAGRVES
jgi:hypothetical protein